MVFWYWSSVSNILLFSKSFLFCELFFFFITFFRHKTHDHCVSHVVVWYQYWMLPFLDIVNFKLYRVQLWQYLLFLSYIFNDVTSHTVQTNQQILLNILFLFETFKPHADFSATVFSIFFSYGTLYIFLAYSVGVTWTNLSEWHVFLILWLISFL